jgi:hypothetical protein
MLQYNPSISGSLNITGSLIISNGMIGTVNGVDVQIFSSSINQVITGIQSTTGSQDGRLTSIETFTSSTSARLNSIETITSSTSARLNSIETITASNIARINSLETTSASVNTLNTTQNGRLDSLENKTGSLATTGSNTFYGNQTISGTVYIANDLVVQGSSSIQYITGSSVSIGTNIVQLNTANPAVRFAGLNIVDSGSIGGSGSFLYDSVQDEFIFVHRGDGTNVTSSHFVLGPETYNSLGNETYLTCNKLSKGTGKEHLVDSNIFDNGTTICLTGNTIVSSGNLIVVNNQNAPTRLSLCNTNCNTAAITELTITSDASSGFSSVGKYSAAVSAYKIISPKDMYIYNETGGDIGVLNNISTGNIKFAAGASTTTHMFISASGYIGIGTSAPTHNLEIANANGSVYQKLNADFGIGYVGMETADDSMRFVTAQATPFQFYTNNTERLRINALGATIMYNNMAAVDGLEIYDTQAYATNTGGTINFGGRYNSSGTYSIHGRISARKENNTDGNNASYMFFATRPNGGNATERVRIASTGETCFACLICPNGLVSRSASYFGSTSDTRIYLDSDIMQGYYSTETYQRFSLGRDVFISGNAGLALGRNNAYVMIGDNGNGTAMMFSVNSAVGSGTSALKMCINSSGHITPGANGTQNLGSSSLRWSTVYTSDLSLSNGIGDYTIVEGENDLFLYNNKQCKVYKFMLEQVCAECATPKKS